MTYSLVSSNANILFFLLYIFTTSRQYKPTVLCGQSVDTSIQEQDRHLWIWISMDIHAKSVDMDMDMDWKFHIHGNPEYL